jgi:hypothetical protein
MTAAYFEDHPTDPDKMIMRKPPLEVQEPPKYSFKAHWEKDGRIGVVGAVVRPDGGVHLLQDFIDPPQRTWVGLTGEEMFSCNLDEEGWMIDREVAKRNVEALLKEKNT